MSKANRVAGAANTAAGASTRLKRAVSAKTTTTLKSPALQILG